MKKSLTLFIVSSIISCLLCIGYSQTIYNVRAQRLNIPGIDISPLTKYAIVPESKINAGGYITEREALEYIAALVCADTEFDKSAQWEWYSYDETRPLDRLSDKDKGLLTALFRGGNDSKWIVWVSELGETDLDAPLTWGHALKYFTRATQERFGCTDSPDELYFTEISQTYDQALKRGFIGESLPDTQYMPIRRQDFYSLAANAAQTEYCYGTYCSQYYTLIETLERKAKENDVQHTPEYIGCTAEWKDDMSLIFHTDPKELDGYHWYTYLEALDKKGDIIDTYMYDFGNSGGSMSAQNILPFIAAEYPRRTARLELSYVLSFNKLRKSPASKAGVLT